MDAIPLDIRNKRVFVGLSGGVDSAVTAVLLKKRGAHVVGVFIQGWYPEGFKCTWASDRRDAMRVAARLSIPFHTLDASKEYKTGVIDYLVREYRAGRTPNPDVMCNREVKFGAFFRFAMEHGADFVATGHYARVKHTKKGVRLYEGINPEKDQSYFLWAVPPAALAKTLFPVGGMHKDDVRVLAKKWNLPVADKRDSQGICFLGNVSMDDFLRSEIETRDGTAVQENGTVVGQHDGSVLYTIGERVALRNAAAGPWYVLSKDLEQNVITVGKERIAAAEQPPFTLTETSFISDVPPRAEARVRYHGARIRGMYDASTHTFTPNIPVAEPVAHGQSLVLYSGTECLGGGIIV